MEASTCHNMALDTCTFQFFVSIVTSKMELFGTVFNIFYFLVIAAKNFILDVAGGKTATNKWVNDDSDILRALYIVYKKIMTILFPYLLVNLFKQRYINHHQPQHLVINGVNIYLYQVFRLLVQVIVSVKTMNAVYLRTIL